MLDLATYATILLIMGIVSSGFMIYVARRQLKLFKKPITNVRGRHFRRNMFLITVIIIVTNLIPIGIDAATLFIDTGRPPQVRVLSFVYAFSIHLEFLLLSLVLWQNYRLATKSELESRKKK